MPTTFDNLTLSDVTKHIPSEPALVTEARELIAGDMWRAGAGWIGEMPSSLEAQAKIQSGIVSENILHEIVTRHVGGVLGREPRWGYVQRTERRAAQVSPGEQAVAGEQEQASAQRITEIGEALTAWWDDRNMLQVLQEAATRVLSEERVPFRILIPPGRRDEKGQIPPCRTLADALNYIYVDTVPAKQAIVYREPKSRLDLGIYSYSEDGVNYAEISYIDDLGRTILRTIGRDDSSEAIDLLRHLLHYDLKRKPLITQQLVQAQKALTLTLTQMMRNVNLAGSRERVFLGAKAPGTWAEATSGDPGAVETSPGSGVWRRFAGAPYQVGAGVTNFVPGEDVVNAKGEIVGATNPNISVTDPVPTTTFENTRNVFRSAMYAQAQQSHALMSDDATASGKSRVEARAEYKSSLDMTAAAINDLGRWVLEVVLYLAGALQRRPALYSDLRCEFGAIVDTGPLSSEEQQEIRANKDAKLVSRETAMSLLGTADVDAELARIANEEKLERETLGPVDTVNLQRSQEALERDRGANGDIQARVAAALEGQES